MNDQHALQTLQLTVKDITNNLTETIATKNLLSIQLAEANQAVLDKDGKIAELQARVEELEAQLAEETEPAKEKGE